jgi:hypothetical protein
LCFSSMTNLVKKPWRVIEIRTVSGFFRDMVSTAYFFIIEFGMDKMERIFPEMCAVLGYYAASCGNCLPTFRDNVSVPS